MNVSQSGDPLGQGACLILAFFRVRILATVSPAEFCTILLSLFCLTLNAGPQPLPESGVRHEWTLEAVSSRPLLGNQPPRMARLRTALLLGAACPPRRGRGAKMAFGLPRSSGW